MHEHRQSVKQETGVIKHRHNFMVPVSTRGRAWTHMEGMCEHRIHVVVYIYTFSGQFNNQVVFGWLYALPRPYLMAHYNYLYNKDIFLDLIKIRFI